MVLIMDSLGGVSSNGVIAAIQKNPDWIFFILGLIVLLFIIIAFLFLKRRSNDLMQALHSIQNLQQKIEALDAKEQSLNEQLIQSNNRNIQYGALHHRWKSDKQELTGSRTQLSEAQIKIASLNTKLEEQEKNNHENILLLNKTGDSLKDEFKSLAVEVMQTHGESFEKSNREKLSQVLQPLKEHIGRFETELRSVHQSALKDRAELAVEIKSLTAQSLQVSKEAENLSRALKSDSQKQGAWGEMILASILERSGLREGEEYQTQVHKRNERGQSIRPDVVVNLPGGRRLVIDSKVSLVAYERAVNAEHDTDREAAVKAHVSSIKAHIDALSAKKYQQFDDGSVDYVIMFMPIESAFSEALSSREGKDLALYATEKNVAIASPINLMLALKTIENLWSVERRNKNALEIAKRAGYLYDKFHGFMEDMDKIGDQLDRTKSIHSAALNKLTSGRGNLVSQVEKLKTLGARTSKKIEIEYDCDDESHASNENLLVSDA
ncbi:MAG: DNA recombination protein RmuC [Kangiellaceae bacterium]|nr:DNA recombination protein RmuC [Kangiellaceae bacterium]